MSHLKTLNDLDVAGKRVLVRVDFNVPMRDGRITDTTRIDRALETLNELADKGAKVVIISHFGRPKGEVKPEMSLRPVAEGLASIAGKDVAFAPDCIGEEAAAVIDAAPAGGFVMLENLRFHAGEEKNDPDFAKALAANGDAFVSDAFSVAHRAHASTEGITHLLPSAAGRLMQAEIEALTGALETPAHPVIAVVGGAKVSTKMAVLGHLSEKVDQIVIGGGMANTFLYANGVGIGNSLCEKEMAAEARAIVDTAANAGCEIVLPLDAVVADKFEDGAASKTVALSDVPDDMMILDIGPKSITDLQERLKSAKTVLWNGPLGAFEVKPFDTGTNAVAQTVAELTGAGSLLSVAGGGDTVAALAGAGAEDGFSYVSAAGGAFLEWIEGKSLPGVAALMA
ncbi:MAG: phosphoglycerate kinase [Rhodospirillales bacterium]|nr:phosphoglycerate kinase [Rhodospirillales bacterium]MBO6788170.1 phosphoglycerate kinase [Rhodospirillales bacterium]